MTLGAATSLPNSVSGQSPWYMLPHSEQLKHVECAPPELKPYIRQFVDDGIAVVEDSITEEMRTNALSAFHGLTRRRADLFDPFRDANGYLSRIINLHAALPEFLDLYLQNKALPLLKYIFGAKPSLYTTLYLERGSQQDIHRDTPFFSTVPAYYFVGFWMALED